MANFKFIVLDRHIPKLRPQAERLSKQGFSLDEVFLQLAIDFCLLDDGDRLVDPQLWLGQQSTNEQPLLKKQLRSALRSHIKENFGVAIAMHLSFQSKFRRK